MGVCFRSKLRKYECNIRKDGKTYGGSVYASEDVAAWVRDCLAKEMYGQEASLNSVPALDGWRYDSESRRAVQNT